MDYFSYEPIVWRLIARDHGQQLGPDEIAKRSGLSRSTVQRISARDWENVRYGAHKKFIHGCVGGVSDKAIRQRIKELQDKGIAGIKSLNPNVKQPLFRRGAAGNTRKFLIRVINKNDQAQRRREGDVKYE